MSDYFWSFGFKAAGGKIYDVNGNVLDSKVLKLPPIVMGTPPIKPGAQAAPAERQAPQLAAVKAKDHDLSHLFFVTSPVFPDPKGLDQANNYVTSGVGKMLYTLCLNCVLYKTQ